MKPRFTWRRLLALTLIAVLFLPAFSPAVYAASTRCFSTLMGLTEPRQDSAVELELSMSPAVMGLVTTSTGKIDALWHSGLEIPPWLEALGRYRLGKRDAALELEWETLGFREKWEVLKHVSKGQSHRFNVNRAIPGLKVRDSIAISLPEATSILGKTLPPGKHDLHLADFFSPKVEYRGPKDVESVAGFELHFRHKESAGKLSKLATEFLDVLKIPRTHQHVHIVGPLLEEGSIPLERQESWAFQLADFVRRANLAAEMTAILENNARITRKASGDIVYFDALDQAKISQIHRYFQSASKGIQQPIGAQFKMAYVGIRGTDTYDQPGLWGLEYRALQKDSDPKKFGPILSALYHAMQEKEYGISESIYKEILSKNKENNKSSDPVAALYYNKPMEQLIESAPMNVRAAVDLTVMSYLQASENDYREVKMLLHDWSQDTIFVRDRSLGSKVARFQLQALDEIREGKNPHDAVAQFLVRSGIYPKILESIGVQVKDE